MKILVVVQDEIGNQMIPHQPQIRGLIAFKSAYSYIKFNFI